MEVNMKHVFLEDCIPCTSLKQNAGQTDNGNLILEGGRARKQPHSRYLRQSDATHNATEQILQTHILISHATAIFLSALKASRWKLKVISIALF
jgi:hypothetical protein